MYSNVITCLTSNVYVSKEFDYKHVPISSVSRRMQENEICMIFSP